MSDAVSLAEIDEQYVLLLPARTVMSRFSTGDWGDCGCGGDEDEGGLLELNLLNIDIL